MLAALVIGSSRVFVQEGEDGLALARLQRAQLGPQSLEALDQLVDAYEVVAEIVSIVAADRTYTSTEPYGEPQLGSRGLYGALGGTSIADAQMAMLWILNQADGEHGLLDIAERSAIGFESIVATADLLVEHELLRDET